MSMCCLWPDCQEVYCKAPCPHKGEIDRANRAEGFVDVEPNSPEADQEMALYLMKVKRSRLTPVATRRGWW